MLLAENRLAKITLVDGMLQVEVMVGFNPIGQDDDVPQRENTTGPVSSNTLDIMWM